mgnify:CR=1 FL=1
MATTGSSRVEVLIGDLDLERVAKQLGDTRPMFAALGMELLKEIYRNFEMGGAWGKWAPLRPGTLLSRRSGGSSRPLQASGQLRASFRSEAGKGQVRVGSPLKIAKYHQEGRGIYVGQPKWAILPRRAKALAFPWAGGTVLGSPGKFKSYGHKKRSAKFLSGTPMAVVRKVMHPGYPPRPMLPPETIALKLAQSVISEMLKGNP